MAIFSSFIFHEFFCFLALELEPQPQRVYYHTGINLSQMLTPSNYSDEH